MQLRLIQIVNSSSANVFNKGQKNAFKLHKMLSMYKVTYAVHMPIQNKTIQFVEAIQMKLLRISSTGIGMHLNLKAFQLHIFFHFILSFFLSVNAIRKQYVSFVSRQSKTHEDVEVVCNVHRCTFHFRQSAWMVV